MGCFHRAANPQEFLHRGGSNPEAARRFQKADQFPFRSLRAEPGIQEGRSREIRDWSREPEEVRASGGSLWGRACEFLRRPPGAKGPEIRRKGAIYRFPRACRPESRRSTETAACFSRATAWCPALAPWGSLLRWEWTDSQAAHKVCVPTWQIPFGGVVLRREKWSKNTRS